MRGPAHHLLPKVYDTGRPSGTTTPAWHMDRHGLPDKARLTCNRVRQAWNNTRSLSGQYFQLNRYYQLHNSLSNRVRQAWNNTRSLSGQYFQLNRYYQLHNSLSSTRLSCTQFSAIDSHNDAHVPTTSTHSIFLNNIRFNLLPTKLTKQNEGSPNVLPTINSNPKDACFTICHFYAALQNCNFQQT